MKTFLGFDLFYIYDSPILRMKVEFDSCSSKVYYLPNRILLR